MTYEEDKNYLSTCAYYSLKLQKVKNDRGIQIILQP